MKTAEEYLNSKGFYNTNRLNNCFGEEITITDMLREYALEAMVGIFEEIKKAMKAEELRIGNFVSYLGKVTQITGTSTGYLSTRLSGAVTENQVEAIPLTVEWLLNGGLEYNRKIDCYQLPDESLILDKNFIVMDMDVRVHLCFVHQLQNLYFELHRRELFFSIK